MAFSNTLATAGNIKGVIEFATGLKFFICGPTSRNIVAVSCPDLEVPSERVSINKGEALRTITNAPSQQLHNVVTHFTFPLRTQSIPFHFCSHSSAFTSRVIISCKVCNKTQTKILVFFNALSFKTFLETLIFTVS